METFKTVSRASRKLNEHNDCAVKAVAIVTNHPYDHVHALFIKHGRPRRRRTHPFITERVLKEIGVFVDVVELPGKTIKTLVFCKESRYLVSVHGHILAVVNGEVQDWTKNRQHRPHTIRKISW